MSIKNLNSMIEHNLGINRFSKIADYLLNEVVIKCADEDIVLTEIEFYYKSDDNSHKDLFTHNAQEQLNSNSFYIHPKSETKKGWGNRAGLDITFGNGKNFGGILIRGIKIKDEYISGPALVLKYLAKLLNANNTKELKNSISNNLLRLEESQNFKKDNKMSYIYQGPRIGLMEAKNEFIAYPYRYLTHVCNEHKFKEKTIVYFYTYKLSLQSETEINSAIGCKSNYKNHYDNLKNSKKSKIKEQKREKEMANFIDKHAK